MSNFAYFAIIPIVIWITYFVAVEVLEKKMGHYQKNKIKWYLVTLLISLSFSGLLFGLSFVIEM